MLAADAMKGFFLLLAGLLVASALVWVISLQEAGGHDVPADKKWQMFGAQPVSREKYIETILRSGRPDDPEIQLRIEAVRRLHPWPE